MRKRRFIDGEITLAKLLAVTSTNDRGCLEWQGSRDTLGYGRIFYRDRTIKTHRLVLKLSGLDILNKDVLHSCDNPPCINPRHLRLGDDADNCRDRYSRNRSPVYDNHWKAILSTQEVSEIRSAHYLGARQADLALLFKVKTPAITKIVQGHTWVSIHV